jgi:hypothetical protein
MDVVYIYIYIYIVSGVPWLMTTGSGLDDWIYWYFFKLQLIKTAHNQWLSLASFLTWLRVSSLLPWLTWFWFTSRPLLQLPLSAGLTLHTWTLKSLTTDLRLTPSSLHSRFYNPASIHENVHCLCVPMEIIRCLRVSVELMLIPLTWKARFVPSRSPRVLIPIETCVSEPLSSSGLFNLPGVMSQNYIWEWKILVRKPERKKPLGDLSVNGRTILVWILNKQGMNVYV